MAGQLAMVATMLAQYSTDGDFNYTYSVGIGLGSMLIGGLIGALIGSSKNRGVLGFFLGALLGCIGWIIIALIPRKNPY